MLMSMKGKYPNSLRSAMEQAGVGPSELARLVDTSKQNVQRWADAERKLPIDWSQKIAPHLGKRPEELVFAEGDVSDAHRSTVILIDGLVGAGGDINPEVQLAYGGDVAQIELDIPIPSGIRAFEVWGNSMLPKYDPGDIVLVQPAGPIDQVLGDVALVVTKDNRRYIKRVLRGSEPGLYNLESFNAPTMPDEELAEVASVYVVVPSKAVRRPVGEKEIKRQYATK